jgi:hypothetical protein
MAAPALANTAQAAINLRANRFCMSCLLSWVKVVNKQAVPDLGSRLMKPGNLIVDRSKLKIQSELYRHQTISQSKYL